MADYPVKKSDDEWRAVLNKGTASTRPGGRGGGGGGGGAGRGAWSGGFGGRGVVGRVRLPPGGARGGGGGARGCSTFV